MTFFEDVNNRMGDIGEKGFYAIPLHRLFSYYLNRLVVYNYLIEKENNPSKSGREIMRDIMIKYFIP